MIEHDHSHHAHHAHDVHQAGEQVLTHAHVHVEFEFFSILSETLWITALVFLFMIIVELLELKYSHIFKKYLTQNKFSQYFVSSALGSTPGCVGVYVVDSFYMAGVVGFGGIVAATIATFGDEAFVLLAAAPKTALILMGITFVLGITGGYIASFIEKIFKLKFKPSCCIEHHEEHENKEHFDIKHFLKDHIWKHVFMKHIPKIFLWLFFSLLLVTFLNEYIEISKLVFEHKSKAMIIAALVALIPMVGPNFILLTLYLSGSIPFSILLVSAIIQDGHGLFPIIGYSIKDALKIKAFNIVYALIIGFTLLAFGL